MEIHGSAKCCWCASGLVKLEGHWWCPTEPCRKRQLAWGIAVQETVVNDRGEVTGDRWRRLWVPLPKQVEFLEMPGKRKLLGGAAGPGKAVAIDTVIQTVSGPRTMAEIAVGDRVFDESGAPCHVVAKSDVHIDPTGTYRMTFDDGSTVIAGGAHGWVTFTYREREQKRRRSVAFRAQRRASRQSRSVGLRQPRQKNSAATLAYEAEPMTGATRTTAEIASSLHVGERINHAVPVSGAWEIPEAALPIDPYVLGVWLGDGSSATGSLTTADPEILYEIEKSGHGVHKMGAVYLWRIEGLSVLLTAHQLKHNKHVPDVYLRASATQRLALLQGLMDTDGCANTDGSVEFCNTNKALAEAVHALAVSLGIKASIAEGRATLYGKDCGPKYRVTWSSTQPVFRLQRKLDRLPKVSRDTQSWRYITACERVADVPVQCVEVDSPSHQYLITEYGIPTHNSHVARFGAYRLCLTTPNLSVLLLRKTRPELERTHIRKMRQEQHDIGFTWMEQAKECRFENGAVIECGHMEDEAAVQKYLSSEYDLIIPEEAVQYPPDPLMELMSRARTSNDRVKALGGPWVWLPTNPGGPSHHLLKALLIDHAPDIEQYPAMAANYKPEQWGYLHATLDDNPYIDPDYEALSLSGLRKARYAQLRHGDWDAAEGTFFEMLSRATHARHVELPGPITGVHESIDWGYTSPGCWKAYAPVGDGHWHCLGEWKFQKLTPEAVAAGILARRLELGIGRGSTVVGDPSMFAKQRGESIAETMGRCGVQLRAGDNERTLGWMRLMAAYQPAPDGVPWLTYEPTCTYSLRSIPALLADKNNPEDVDTRLDDHAADTDRYFVMSRPSFSAPKSSEPTYAPNTWGWWKRIHAQQEQSTGVLA